MTISNMLKPLGIITGILLIHPAYAVSSGDILINELAWTGTTVSASDEWIELRNTTSIPINLTGWTLKATDGTPNITLSGSLAGGAEYLLERTDDTSVPGISADLIYTGAMENGGEVLELRDPSGTLIDSVDVWYAGDNVAKATMERTQTGWQTASSQYDVGFGSPKAANGGSAQAGAGTQQYINQIYNQPGSINVYFNKSALPGYADYGNEANYQVNLEDRLIARIAAVTSTIDVATYEINLPGIVDALLERAAAGVRVRVIADAKAPSDPEHAARYDSMRLYVEQLRRGRDGTIGTADDIAVFSDSVMFTVEDPTLRDQYNLPATPTGLVNTTVAVGSGSQSGFLLADGEQKASGGYYSADNQMHNKFMILDGTWVWTGSWNFTLTGLYGSAANRTAGILDGNSQHAVELNSTSLAAAYTTEFDEMWGSSSSAPNPPVSNFHSRKSDNTPHTFDVGGRTVELYFSPGDDALGKVNTYLQTQANTSVDFLIFAWSDQSLVDTLKVKWEGSAVSLQGTPTGFSVRGVFDGSFWNQWWSASVDMTGRVASQESIGNPNTRWSTPAPVFADAEARKLHAKTMIVDACTVSDPSVIVGSTNWSNNGNLVNDENLLIIHDGRIVNQFIQEFYARYQAAGGVIPDLGGFSCSN